MSSVERVREFFTSHGIEIDVRELDKSTRTAQLAAEAIGTELGSIVKSLVFLADGRIALVLVSGDRRADSAKLAKVLGARDIRIATAEEVKNLTGFAIGGVPPVGHREAFRTIIDRTLGRFETVYAAAGSPRAIFPVTFQQLVELIGGQLEDIVEDA